MKQKGFLYIGYETECLPAFYTRKSEHKLNFSTDSIDVIAETLKTKWELNLKGGAVIANPIPEELRWMKSISMALSTKQLKKQKKIILLVKIATPFLLGKIKELTDGKSLDANIELVKHNAKVGAQIAVSFNSKTNE